MNVVTVMVRGMSVDAVQVRDDQCGGYWVQRCLPSSRLGRMAQIIPESLKEILDLCRRVATTDADEVTR